jgi:hypothetical protein
MRMSPQTREGAGLKAGAVLVRERKGRLERVTVLEEGFTSEPSSTFGPYSAYEPRKAAYPAIHYSCARHAGRTGFSFDFEHWCRRQTRCE